MVEGCLFRYLRIAAEIVIPNRILYCRDSLSFTRPVRPSAGAPWLQDSQEVGGTSFLSAAAEPAFAFEGHLGLPGFRTNDA
jgi:hypothetical protein